MNTKKVCPKDKTELVENYAMGKQFWYCCNCKDEIVNYSIVPEKTLSSDDSMEELMHYFNHLME